MITKTNLTTWLIISVFLAVFAPAVAAGGTIYVDTGAGGANNGSSWGDAYNYLQDALAGAGGGDDIWVAAGTYKPDGSSIEIEDLVTTGLSTPYSIALDVVAGKMYWTDAGTDKIQRANLDGSSVEDLVTSGLSGPAGIALDVVAGKMYWVDSFSLTDQIRRANMDGSSVQNLVTGLSAPRGIVLDVAAGKMYWTDYGTDKIQRANMSDGSSVEDLVTTNLTFPGGIALDVAGGKMYWTDYHTFAGTGKIQRANMSDGSNVEDLVTTGLSLPHGIALDVAAGKMYWTDSGTDKIQRANMSDGSGVEDLVTTGLSGPWGIALDAAAGKMYWTDYDTDKIQRANMDSGSGSRTATFQLINGVAIYGGFAGTETTLNERDWETNVTVLSGDINVPDVNTDNSYHVVTGSFTDATAILDGFTITKGNANGSWPNSAAGGMYNASGSPMVTSCAFSGNSANFGSGMFNNSSSPTVTNCTFSGNSATNKGGGMQNGASSSPTVTNCTFTGNSATNNGGGMLNASSSPGLVNCTFSGNSAGTYGGGMYNELSSPTVTNCTFSGNSAGSLGGGMYNDSGNPTVTNCIFWGNGGEINPTSLNVTYSNVAGGYSGTGNINADPLFVDAAGGDLRLLAGSPCIDAGDNTAVPADTADLDNDANTTERTPLDLAGNARFTDDPETADTGVADPPDYPQVVDMGAYEYGVIIYGVIIYVDEAATGANNGSNWTNAYNYLADALADADARTEPVQIWVAQGTYKPDEGGGETPGDRMATFQLINGVEIYGGFPSGGGLWSQRAPDTYETILSGDIGTVDVNSDNSYHVVTGSGTEPNAVLDGFTITDGNANGGSYPSDHGGGMFNSTGSPTIINCIFIANAAHESHGSGAGMFNGANSDPTLINCIFSDNKCGWGGGGMANDNWSSPALTNCLFRGNYAGNHGGGMANFNGSSPTVTNCTFSGNDAGNWGGGMWNYSISSPTVTNCTFIGNSAGGGGGMYNDEGSSPTVTNCTFSGNIADANGGGVYDSNSSPTLTNCILWGNTDSGPTDESAQISGIAPAIDYSCVQGWTGGLGGTGNIGDDPNFVDPNGPDNTVGTEDDDLSLSFDSPCIDAGGNIAVSRDTADLDGDGDTHECLPFDLDGNARFTDDPNTVDTGNPGFPGLPIVDMGAYEWYGGPACGDAEHPYPPGDVSGPDGVPDCYIDFFDFAVWALHWLEYTGPE